MDAQDDGLHDDEEHGDAGPSSGIGLFYADSGFFDGKNRVLWRIGSKPFL